LIIACYIEYSDFIGHIIKSIAEEENALSKTLDFGGEIIQKSKKGARNINDFVSVNESVNSIIVSGIIMNATKRKK
jgi:hypothetical protein